MFYSGPVFATVRLQIRRHEFIFLFKNQISLGLVINNINELLLLVEFNDILILIDDRNGLNFFLLITIVNRYQINIFYRKLMTTFQDILDF